MIVNNSISLIERETVNPVQLKPQNDLEAEKKQLMKSAKEMESLFLNQLLKSMRATIPESDDKGMGLGGGMGKDIYTQMFDEEISMKMAGIGNRSLASVIYKSMERLLVAKHSTGENKANPIKDIMPAQKYVKINNVLANRIATRSTGEIGGRGDRLFSRYDKIISKVADKYSLSPDLIKAVIKTESNFDTNAISSAGAKGLMQLIDTTASDMQVNDVFDPADNIEGGSKYLRKMIDQFGDLKTALAAYNAGPGNVQNYGGIPPFKETHEYIERVLNNVGDEKLSFVK